MEIWEMTPSLSPMKTPSLLSRSRNSEALLPKWSPPSLSSSVTTSGSTSMRWLPSPNTKSFKRICVVPPPKPPHVKLNSRRSAREKNNLPVNARLNYWRHSVCARNRRSLRDSASLNARLSNLKSSKKQKNKDNVISKKNPRDRD